MKLAHSGFRRPLRLARRTLTSFAVVLLALLSLASGPAFAGRMLYTGGHWIYPEYLSAFGGNTMTVVGGSDASYSQAFAGTYGAFDAIVVGEGSPVPSVAVRAQIVDYVNNGGRVIVTGSHGGPEVAFIGSVPKASSITFFTPSWSGSASSAASPVLDAVPK